MHNYCSFSKKNLDKLIEAVLLQAEMLDLKTNFEKSAKGIVLESKIDTGRGPVVSTIVTAGTLKTSGRKETY